MTAWVDDIIQALKNLGGQATLNEIYAEFERIRVEPLPKSWQANIRGRIENYSSDSDAFTGKDYFKKVSKGTWALRDLTKIDVSKPLIKPDIQHNTLSGFVLPDSFETVTNALQTLKQYRDYYDPSSPAWMEYIREFFHIIGFGTENLDSRLFLIEDLGGSDISKAIVGYSLPGENFEEIIPGLKWETYLLFAANYHHLHWGFVTNGLQLKVISYKSGSQQQISFWPDLDGIIKDQKSDSFFPIYKLFAHIKQEQSALPGNQKIVAQTSPSKQANSSGKYGPIQTWLENQTGSGKTTVQISFQQIEALIGDDLPPSAYSYKVWWANGGHLQAFAWLNAGWNVENVNLNTKQVVFSQSSSSLGIIQSEVSIEKPYKSFFDDLLTRLKDKRPGVTQAAKTQPREYFSFSAGRSGVTFGWVLPKEPVLRIELYIDVGDEVQNKIIFDRLFNDKTAIENELSSSLNWERLDHRRASRVSVSIPFTFTDSEETQDAAKQWGVDMMLKFIDVFKPRVRRL